MKPASSWRIACLVSAALIATACSTQERSGGSAFSFEEPLAVNVSLNRRAASTIAVTRAAEAPFREVQAFVTLADDDATGLLFVRVDDAAPMRLADADAIPVLDPETPPQVAIGSNNAIHVAYAASSSLADKWSTMAIRHVKSIDEGRTWSAPVTIGGVSFSGYRNDHELHVAEDGYMYAGWLDSNFADPSSGAILAVVSSSSDGGATWSTPAPIDQNPSCECCRVALASRSDGTVIAAWRKIIGGEVRDIVVAESADRGRTWSAPTRVFADDWLMDHCPDAGPALGVDETDRVHVAWWTGKEGAAGVKYARTDGGSLDFGSPVSLKLDSLSRASHVQLAARAGEVVVVWDDGALKEPRIAIRRSLDGGDTFSPLEYVSPGTYSAHYPVLAIGSGGRITVAWHRRGGPEVMSRAGESGGSTYREVGAQGPDIILVRTAP